MNTDPRNCSDALLKRVLAIFFSVDVKLYLEVVEWLEPHLRDVARHKVGNLIRQIKSPYSFVVIPDEGLCLINQISGEIQDDFWVTKSDYTEVPCFDNENRSGRIVGCRCELLLQTDHFAEPHYCCSLYY